jgi:hypothetical protein
MIMPNGAVIIRELERWVKMASAVLAKIHHSFCGNKNPVTPGTENTENGLIKLEYRELISSLEHMWSIMCSTKDYSVSTLCGDAPFCCRFDHRKIVQA